MVVGFMVLNLKAMVLLALDLFRLVVPPEEKSLAGELVLVGDGTVAATPV